MVSTGVPQRSRLVSVRTSATSGWLREDKWGAADGPGDNPPARRRGAYLKEVSAQLSVRLDRRVWVYRDRMNMCSQNHFLVWYLDRALCRCGVWEAENDGRDTDYIFVEGVKQRMQARKWRNIFQPAPHISYTMADDAALDKLARKIQAVINDEDRARAVAAEDLVGALAGSAIQHREKMRRLFGDNKSGKAFTGWGFNPTEREVDRILDSMGYGEEVE